MLLYLLAALVALPLLAFMALWVARERRRPRTRRGQLEPLERRLLEVLVERSDPEVSRRLSRQIELSRLHCRLHFEKSMTLEVFPDKPDWSKLDAPDVAFPTKEELRLGELSFEAGGHRFKAHFGAVNRHLFDIVVRPNPRKVLHVSEITGLRFEKGDDPMVPAELAPGEPKDALQEFEGFLAEWARRFSIAEPQPPLKAAVRDRWIAKIDATLPGDYVMLMRQVNGISVGEWEILGLPEVYSVALGEHDYYILASNGDFYLAVRRGARDGVVYSCSTASEEPLEEASFRAAIEQEQEDGESRAE